MAYIVVTGGAGFIGGNLVEALIQNKHTVTCIDDLSTGSKSNLYPRVLFKKIDIRDIGGLMRAMKGMEYVFHLAALPRIQRSIQDPLETNEVNVQGTLNVLEAARINKVKRVIFTSSSSVYGDQKKFPLTEALTPHPLSPYALQKYIGEQYCKLYSNLHGVDVKILRLFSVYGPGMNGKNEYDTVIGRFHYLKKHNKSFEIYGDGRQKRDFTYVGDVVRALYKAMNMTNSKQIINICTGRATSIGEIAQLMEGKIVYKDKRIGESQIILGSNALAKKILHWSPQISIERGITML